MRKTTMKTLRQLQTVINDYIEKHPENLDREVFVSCSDDCGNEYWSYLYIDVEPTNGNAWQIETIFDFCEDEEQ